MTDQEIYKRSKQAAETIISICTDYLTGGQHLELFKQNIRMYSKYLYKDELTKESK